jgi:hypothetical protein
MNKDCQADWGSKLRLQVDGRLVGACIQRTGLCAGWELEFRLPVTKVDNCNIADVLFISQIYNVLLELKLN